MFIGNNSILRPLRSSCYLDLFGISAVGMNVMSASRQAMQEAVFQLDTKEHYKFLTLV